MDLLNEDLVYLDQRDLMQADLYELIVSGSNEINEANDTSLINQSKKEDEEEEDFITSFKDNNSVITQITLMNGEKIWVIDENDNGASRNSSSVNNNNNILKPLKPSTTTSKCLINDKSDDSVTSIVSDSYKPIENTLDCNNNEDNKEVKSMTDIEERPSILRSALTSGKSSVLLNYHNHRQIKSNEENKYFPDNKIIESQNSEMKTEVSSSTPSIIANNADLIIKEIAATPANILLPETTEKIILQNPPPPPSINEHLLSPQIITKMEIDMNNNNGNIPVIDSEANKRKPCLKSTHHCHICKKSFKDRYSVNVHIRTHTGEKPFSCQFCGKKFRQKAHLAKHNQTHAIKFNPSRNLSTETAILI